MTAFPQLAWMMLYYWLLAEPRHFPPLAVFLLGLLQEALFGLPLGLLPLLYLLLYWQILKRRFALQDIGFFKLWTYFAGMTLFLQAGHAFLLDILFGLSLSWQASATSSMLTIVLYPLLHYAADLFLARRPSTALF